MHDKTNTSDNIHFIYFSRQSEVKLLIYVKSVYKMTNFLGFKKHMIIIYIKNYI